jgi:hypothetical protein
MNTDLGGWRIARGPEADGDDWIVMFRMDDREPDAEGPQIVVTGSPMVSTPVDDEEEYEPHYGNRVDREYQFWGAEGELGPSRWEADPDEYRTGWESESLSEAVERGQIAIQQIAAVFEFRPWDGSIEALG